MSVVDAIRNAEEILPGIPIDNGIDPRWQAIIAVGNYIESDPEAVWEFARQWGRYPDDDLRAAIATCLLEHLLEHYFAAFFQRVEELAIADSLFGDTFLRCSPFGQSLDSDNAKQFEALAKGLLATWHGDNKQ